MTKVLVTGGAGFIGSHLVDKLVDLGYAVKIIDNLSTGKQEYVNKKAKFYKIDIRNYQRILPVFHGIDYVFHLAALPRIQRSIENIENTHNVNVNGTLNVLIAAKIHKIKKVIYASSSSIYGEQMMFPLKEAMFPNPLSPYAAQKLMGEYYCKIFYNLYGLNSVILRYFSVYGPHQDLKGEYCTVIPTFMHLKQIAKPLTIYGDGEQKRDFTYISDVVDASIQALESNKVGKGEVINICFGKPYSINHLAKIFGGKKTYLKSRKGEPEQTWGNNSLAKKLLGWTSQISLEQGLKILLS